MAEVLALLAVAVPATIGLLGAGAAAWGFAAFTSRDRRAAIDRRELGVAVAVMAGLGGLAAWAVAASLACFPSDATACATRAEDGACIAGLAGGALTVAAALAGAGLALRAPGRNATAGAIAGPVAALALTVAVAAAGGARAGAGAEARARQAAADLATRSSALGLVTANVRPTLTSNGVSVTSVHLTARLRTSVAIRLAANGKVTYPRFTLTAPLSIGVDGTLATPPGRFLAAGSLTTYALTFDYRGLSILPGPGRDVAGTYGAPRPGIWQLHVELEDESGLTYEVSTEIAITAPS